MENYYSFEVGSRVRLLHDSALPAGSVGTVVGRYDESHPVGGHRFYGNTYEVVFDDKGKGIIPEEYLELV